MSHLRLVPRPLAKCDRPYPKRLDGVELRREGTAVREQWRLTHARGGRVFEVYLTTAELEDLVMTGLEQLGRNKGDE